MKRYRKTFTHDGKRYYISAETQEKADMKAEILKRDLIAGKREISRNTTVRAWSLEWLETYKRPVVNMRHYSDLKRIVKTFVCDNIGGLQIGKVRPVHLQKILNGLTGYSDSYIKKIADVIKQIFRTAYDNDLTLTDITRGLVVPSSVKETQSRRAITDAERMLIKETAETNRGGLFFLIMLYCGLRPGEIAALTWKDIDFSRGLIHVTKAVKASGEIGKPKSAAGVRSVPVPSYLLERLAARRADPFALVCTNSTGGRLTKDSYRNLWECFRRDMAINAGGKLYRNRLILDPVAPDLTPYCLRHTYCTDLQAAGVPINVARELMGHSSIEITAKIYTHSSDVALDNAAALIEKYASK